MCAPSRLDRVLPDFSPRPKLSVCARCFGVGVIETTLSIGVSPVCDDCDGRGYVVDHAAQSAVAESSSSSENAGEQIAQHSDGDVLLQRIRTLLVTGAVI